GGGARGRLRAAAVRFPPGAGRGQAPRCRSRARRRRPAPAGATLRGGRRARRMTPTLGIATPILTRTSEGPPWLATGTIEDVATVVTAADRLGFAFCTCSEHIGIPEREIGRRGAAYWDPLSTFGFLAARTTNIEFVTWVLV